MYISIYIDIYRGIEGFEKKKMSSGVKGGASRVSIPSGVKKTIENIKEITGQNHSEDEIYAMLKECSMDPNETTQKLLLLGESSSLWLSHFLFQKRLELFLYLFFF